MKQIIIAHIPNRFLYFAHFQILFHPESLCDLLQGNFTLVSLYCHLKRECHKDDITVSQAINLNKFTKFDSQEFHFGAFHATLLLLVHLVGCQQLLVVDSSHPPLYYKVLTCIHTKFKNDIPNIPFHSYTHTHSIPFHSYTCIRCATIMLCIEWQSKANILAGVVGLNVTVFSVGVC